MGEECGVVVGLGFSAPRGYREWGCGAVGPARSCGGGQLGHMAQGGRGSVVSVLFCFPFIYLFIYLFIFPSVLFKLKYLCIF